MPEMPAFLANVLEPRFARAAQVLEVEELAPRLRRIRFGGKALQGLSFRAGQEIEFRVSERSFRHYTPSAYDRDAGSIDVVFFLHGKGPGSRWASALIVGSNANVLGPGGRFGLDPSSRHHVLVGDESALGLFACLSAGRSDVEAVVEVEQGAEGWPHLVGLGPSAHVTRHGSRGDALREWLSGRRLASTPTPETTVYLAGHAQTIARLQKELTTGGWGRAQLRTKPYWADGKRGL
jgi:NADPH-dependent ferric siderophore reductase